METSNLYPVVAPESAFQFAEKSVAVILVAAVAVGAPGNVVGEISFDAALDPLALYAYTV